MAAAQLALQKGRKISLQPVAIVHEQSDAGVMEGSGRDWKVAKPWRASPLINHLPNPAGWTPKAGGCKGELATYSVGSSFSPSLIALPNAARATIMSASKARWEKAFGGFEPAPRFLRVLR